MTILHSTRVSITSTEVLTGWQPTHQVTNLSDLELIIRGSTDPSLFNEVNWFHAAFQIIESKTGNVVGNSVWADVIGAFPQFSSWWLSWQWSRAENVGITTSAAGPNDPDGIYVFRPYITFAAVTQWELVEQATLAEFAVAEDHHFVCRGN